MDIFSADVVNITCYGSLPSNDKLRSRVDGGIPTLSSCRTCRICPPYCLCKVRQVGDVEALMRSRQRETGCTHRQHLPPPCTASCPVFLTAGRHKLAFMVTRANSKSTSAARPCLVDRPDPQAISNLIAERTAMGKSVFLYPHNPIAQLSSDGVQRMAFGRPTRVAH
jgi:hypothetical protein